MDSVSFVCFLTSDDESSMGAEQKYNKTTTFRSDWLKLVFCRMLLSKYNRKTGNWPLKLPPNFV